MAAQREISHSHSGHPRASILNNFPFSCSISVSSASLLGAATRACRVRDFLEGAAHLLALLIKYIVRATARHRYSYTWLGSARVPGCQDRSDTASPFAESCRYEKSRNKEGWLRAAGEEEIVQILTSHEPYVWSLCSWETAHVV